MYDLLVFNSKVMSIFAYAASERGYQAGIEHSLTGDGPHFIPARSEWLQAKHRKDDLAFAYWGGYLQALGGPNSWPKNC